jgi:hypothetical protein
LVWFGLVWFGLVWFVPVAPTWSIGHPVGILARVTSPSQSRYLTQTQNKHRQTSMPRVGFEPTIPAFERAKTVHASGRVATAFGVTERRRSLQSKKQRPMYRACLSVHLSTLNPISWLNCWPDFLRIRYGRPAPKICHELPTFRHINISWSPVCHKKRFPCTHKQFHRFFVKFHIKNSLICNSFCFPTGLLTDFKQRCWQFRVLLYGEQPSPSL